MTTPTRILRALVLATLLSLAAGEAFAQEARPVGAVAAMSRGDSTPPVRQVRELPVVFGGALLGGGLGLLAGAAVGAGIGGTGQDTGSNEYFSTEAVGAILGGAVGYAVGAGLGAHFTASGKPRPNALPTIGISAATAIAASFVAGGLGSAGVSEGSAYVLFVAVPLAHLALTSEFARWRAQRR